MIPLFCFFPSLAAKQKKKETAKEIVEDLMDGAEKLLAGAPGFLA